MMYGRILISICLAGLVSWTPGCAGERPARQPTATVVAQMPTLQVARVDPSLRGQRYSVLLNFELPSDDAFVTASGGAGSLAIDARRAMTGAAALRITPSAGRVDIKIGSLLAGREFPAAWALLGGSLYAERPATATITLHLTNGQTLSRLQAVDPGQWSAAWIDITALPPDAQPTVLSIEIAGKTDVWLDDVLMTDNTLWMVGRSLADEPWSVHRRGYAIHVESPQRFRMKLDTSAGKPNGWTVEEVGPARLRLSSAGETRFLTIYADGRSYWDGQLRPLSPQAREEGDAHHRSPAAVAVPPEMGRPDRNTPGDDNNDAYNQRLGAYQIIANGPRVNVTLTPRSAPAIRPVLEITGLPEGKPLVTVEGRLVESVERTRDGRLLVMLPFRIDRPTTVNVRVSDS